MRKNQKYPRHEGGTFVYYLPEEHYVGVSASHRFPHRMCEHRSKGRDIEGWKILFHSEDRKQAKLVESQFHIILGCEGGRWNNNE